MIGFDRAMTITPPETEKDSLREGKPIQPGVYAMDVPDVIDVRGGVPLEGSLRVRGSKNSVPKTMVAALLTSELCYIDNVSNIRDIDIVNEMLVALGCHVTRSTDHVEIKAAEISPTAHETLADFHSRSRIPVLTCAPLLHRTGSALIYQPGGCEIGERPVDLHIQILEAFGARIEATDNAYVLTADGRPLSGATFTLSYPSVGATEQFLLAAVLARGDSVLSNAAIEPEIVDLACVLQKMGALVTVLPDRVIKVSGVDRLHGYRHRSMPDRLEAASWACAALATNGRIEVIGARQADMMTFLNVFRRAGGEFEMTGRGIAFHRGEAPLRPLAIETDVHPGFMTDWQAPLVTALTQADGVSVLHETVYENRLGYTAALNSLGANVQVFRECLGPTPCRFGSRNAEHSAVIVGPTRLHGSELYVPDLRAGFSYFLAAVAADGWSRIHGASLINRGYEDFVDKLTGLGVEMK
jgi:UDP-N-acetylglucosamine 1-carboxyvinyltransferase